MVDKQRKFNQREIDLLQQVPTLHCIASFSTLLCMLSMLTEEDLKAGAVRVQRARHVGLGDEQRHRLA